VSLGDADMAGIGLVRGILVFDDTGQGSLGPKLPKLGLQGTTDYPFRFVIGVRLEIALVEETELH
jgi:hypothetical protein